MQARDVGDHEQQRPRARLTRNGDVVLAEHARGQEPEDLSDLRSLQQRPQLREHAGHRPHVLGYLLAHRRLERFPHPLGRRLEEGAETRRAGADPLGSAHRLHVDDVARELQPGEPSDLQFRNAYGLVEHPTILIGRLGIGTLLQRGRDAHLSGELPVDRP